jgi:hypothetical protein
LGGRLGARDGRGSLKEFGDAGKVDVATTQDHDHAIARDHGDMSEEQRGKGGGARRLNHLFQSLHRKSQTTEDLLVGQGDEPIK